MIRASAVCLLVLAFGSVPVSAATFTVNSTVDAVDATIDGTCASAAGVCTLRAAVQESNASSTVDDVIIVPAGKYTLKLVGAGENAGASGDLDILDDVQMVGAGAKPTVIKGKKDRVIHVGPGITVTITDLTIAGGKVGRKGDIGDEFNGGGLLVESATISLQNVVVAKNGASDDGGGIAAIDSVLTLTDVLIAGNKSGDDAGGADLDGSEGTFTNVTVSKNKAGDEAGGIEIEDAALTLTNCTLSANAGAEDGGGLGCEQGGTASLVNVTLKGNKVKGKVGGGGISHDGTCTIAIHNTLLDKNKPGNCDGVLQLDGGNRESGATCGLGASSNLKLLVAGLKNNGGATPTHAIKEGSPAIDHGFDCPPTDQRGFPRVGDCDTGAFEFQPEVP